MVATKRSLQRIADARPRLTVLFAGDARAKTTPPHTPTATTLPRWLRRALISLTFTAALSALAGGGALLAMPNELAAISPPAALLAFTPFTSFLVPGLLLTVVVGGTSLAAGALLWRRSRLAVDAAVLAGGALTIWIVAELAMFRAFHWLHGIFGAVGLAILALAVIAAVLRPIPRMTWILVVTAGEALGFLFPAFTGVLAAQAGAGDVQQGLLVVVAGCAEGFFLGLAQAWAWPRVSGGRVRPSLVRYALLMGGGAGLAWASAMTIVALGGSDAVPGGVVALVGVVAGVVAILAVAGAPLFELRRFVDRRGARLFFAWTALAWVVALPMSFLAAPFVDESTPLLPALALWGSAGALMAYTMALVTWRGARRAMLQPIVATTGR